MALFDGLFDTLDARWVRLVLRVVCVVKDGYCDPQNFRTVPQGFFHRLPNRTSSPVSSTSYENLRPRWKLVMPPDQYIFYMESITTIKVAIIEITEHSVQCLT